MARKTTIIMTTRLEHGTPQIYPKTSDDKSALDTFKVGLNDGETVRVTFEVITKLTEDRERKRAHYFSYLEECASKCGCFEDICGTTNSMERQKQNLHVWLKSVACTLNPNFLRRTTDIEGEVRYFIFTMSGDGERQGKELELSAIELDKYLKLAFEYLIKIQETAHGWHIPTYTENSF